MSELLLGDDPPPPKRRPRWVDTLGLSAIVLGMVAIGVLGDRGSGDEGRRTPSTTGTTLRSPRRVPYSSTSSTSSTTTTLPAPVTLGRIHDVETDTVLLLQGQDGWAQVLDVDTGVLRRVRLTELGVPPIGIPGGFLLGRHDGLLLLPVDADEPTTFSPDAPAESWPVGATDTTVWLQSTQGIVPFGVDGLPAGRGPKLPESAYPVAAVDRGIVVDQFDSLTLVELSGTVRALGHGTFWGAGGDTLARVSCETLRCSLELVDLGTGEARAISGLDQVDQLEQLGRFSPDGRWFAYKVIAHGSMSLVLVDVVRARATALDDGGPVTAYAFAERGDALFTAHRGTLRIYDPASGDWEPVEGISTSGVMSIAATSR